MLRASGSDEDVFWTDTVFLTLDYCCSCRHNHRNFIVCSTGKWYTALEQPHDELHLAIGGQDHKPLAIGGHDHDQDHKPIGDEVAGACDKKNCDPDLAEVSKGMSAQVGLAKVP